MTSALRLRVAKKLLSPIQALLDRTDSLSLPFLIPTSLKLLKGDSPKFEISWKELLRLKPDLEQRIHFHTLFTYLQNQNYPVEEGIEDVEMKTSPHESFVFSLNQQVFTKTVLRDLCKDFNGLCDRSCYFHSIPKEHIVIDYSSPNIAKPFHFGHFRSTIIGNFIANISRYVGHKVVAINYIGDWGLQYGILASGFASFGSEEKLKEDPLLHLYEVYKEANTKASEDAEFSEQAKAHFYKMENGEAEAMMQWKKFKELSLKSLEETYKKLDIKFDEVHGESMYVEKAVDMLQILVDKNVASCESDGSIQAILNDGSNSEEKVVLRKSDGTTLYLTRDIAAAVDRRNRYHFDNMYYVVDSSQLGHFSNLFYLLNKMGCPWHKSLHHVQFGRIHKFSTRKGNVVFLHDILNEAQERTLEGIKKSPTTKISEDMEHEVSYALGISALIINDLSKRRRKAYEFDWDKVLSMTSDSGITLQYCHARLNNIKNNCGVQLQLGCDLSPLVEPEAVDLIQHLAKFDEVLHQSYTELEPCMLVHYLFQLKQAVGKANSKLTVKGKPMPLAMARLMLFHTAQIVMAKGLEILSIRPLDQM